MVLPALLRRNVIPGIVITEYVAVMEWCAAHRTQIVSLIKCVHPTTARWPRNMIAETEYAGAQKTVRYALRTAVAAAANAARLISTRPSLTRRAALLQANLPGAVDLF